MLRIIHADARALDDGQFFGGFQGGDKKIVAQQIMTVELFVYFHRATEQAGAAGPASQVFHRFHRAQQDGGSMALAFRHDIHAEIHAVNEINVGMSGRAEHDLRPRGPSPGGMRREIVLAQVSLDFHNFSDARDAAGPVYEQLSRQFAGDQSGVAVVKFAGQFLHAAMLA